MRLGLDIGGTKTDAVAVDDAGVIVERVRLETGFGADAVIRTALDGIERISRATGNEAGRFDSIGVGIPGQVDTLRGTVSHAVNLGFDELDVGGRLSTLLGRGVKVENDVKAAALGAYRLLTSAPDAAAGARSMAYLNLGTGLAAGLVIDGELWRGARGAAGEIGHIPVDPGGALCPCGQRGCLETLGSGSAIARQWATADLHPVLSLLAAAEAGDLEAVGIRDRFVGGVAAAIRVLVLTLDVELVMIGGGLSNLGSWLLDEVRAVLSSWAEESPFLASLGLDGRVLLVPAGFPAAAVGAARVGAPVATAAPTATDAEKVGSWPK
jgi:glucokinase